MFKQSKRGISSLEAIHSFFRLFFTEESKLDIGFAGFKSYPRSSLLFFLILAYSLLLFFCNHFSLEHIVFFSFTLTLYYWRPGTKQFILLIAPLLLVAIIYDSMNLYTPYIRGKIHVAEPYFIEKALFGIQMKSGLIKIPNEILQENTHIILDFFCGLAYLLFLIEYIALCFYFYAAGLWRILRKAAWSFFLVNILGYITYYIYPAAPPWYVEKYGLGPAFPEASSDPAGALRFDALLGTSLFSEMYSKAANVFGAIPSLHVSYPLLAVFYAFQVGRFRSFTIAFSLLVCFSAVYLNHHYIIDVTLGLLYAIFSFFCIEAFFKNRSINPNRLI